MKRKFYSKLVRRSKILLTIILGFVLLSACQKKIDRQTLVNIYVENIVIEETYSNDIPLLNKKLDEMFKNYKTTKSEYEAELRNLGNDKEKWTEFFKQAYARLEELKKSGAIN